MYLWVGALASCGPVIFVFFEQSPKVAFVIVGLIAHSLLIFETVGLIYLLGVIITLGGYAISIFGLPHLSVELPETVYSSLNDMKVLTMILTNSQLIESPQPLRGVIFSVIASILLLEWFIGRFFEHLLQLLDTSNLSY